MEKELVAAGSKLWLRPEFQTIPSCPGCQEPVAMQLILEVLEEMGLVGDTVMVGGVGCNTFLCYLSDLDFVATAHGRPPDVATAIKRILPQNLVFTLQGDGDCIAIGAGALINAAGRGEKISVIMVNNTNYGTTGGQMAPTSLLGQRTSTTPQGRTPAQGYPVHVPELLSTFQGVVYTARGAVNTAANFQRTKRYVRTAFETQLADLGMSYVEIIVACPPNWHLTPLECLELIEQKVIPEFSLGEFKKPARVEEPTREAVPVGSAS